MPYVNVAKPTSATYTNVNGAKPSFDEPGLTYDDSTMVYDGVGVMYTNIAKPIGGRTLLQVGMTMGLIIPLTNSREQSLGSPYTKIFKPT